MIKLAIALISAPFVVMLVWFVFLMMQRGLFGMFLAACVVSSVAGLILLVKETSR